MGEVQFVTYAIALDGAETYGDCLTCPLSHIDVGGVTKSGAGLLTPLDTPIRAMIAMSEYEECPRGRVVFEGATQGFLVYADRQCFTYAKQIREEFHLVLSNSAAVRCHFCTPRTTRPNFSYHRFITTFRITCWNEDREQ